VLGLGDIGPEAAMPVMEGKAMLFKEFGGIDAWPICLNTKDTEEIIRVVKALEPTFGGINLEDISAPRCFEIEERLKAEMGIPVFHDDQHGTAVVVLAALLNSLKIIRKRIEDMKIVVAGVGASGVACSKIFLNAGARNIIGVDRIGSIYKGRKQGMNFMKDWYAAHTNPFNEKGKLSDVIAGADLFLGLAGPGLVTVDDLKRMAKDPLVFAMANPDPEIRPEDADGLPAVMATGRSDYPNQINNVLAFPGIFRGALDVGATDITEAMKVAAAKAIADSVDEDRLSPNYVVPSVFDRDVPYQVAQAVAEAALAEGICRPPVSLYS
jgi:malate dehydrogenase (oxaloacetate-decarboxylating)